MKPFTIITAATTTGGIGKGNDLPWRLRKEMAYFTNVTTKTSENDKQNAVIMGRRNWDSIPTKFRPLKNRLNYVISRTIPKSSDDFIPITSLDEALNDASERKDIDKVFVVGGAQIYAMALEHPKCQHILYTQVMTPFECDVFFPKISNVWTRQSHETLEKVVGFNVPIGTQKENNTEYEFQLYSRA